MPLWVGVQGVRVGCGHVRGGGDDATRLKSSDGIVPNVIEMEGEYSISKMDEDQYPRGNVRMTSKGEVAGISMEAADRIKLHRRANRPGLLYDVSVPGFSPAGWPHVVVAPPTGEGWCRLVLEDALGGHPSLVTIDYVPTVSTKLMASTRTFLGEHRKVRNMEEDPAAGYMVSSGMHMRRTGFAGPFYLESATSKRRVAAAQEVAGHDFAKLWVGRRAGFEEMLYRQREASPPGTPWWPVYWAASENLGNAMHVDHDGDRGFAVWMAEHGHLSESRNWWFLIPRYGVAIQLTHGACLSWDGRAIEHATSVPSVAEGDRLMAAFTSIPENLLRAYAKNEACKSLLRERSAEPSEPAERAERAEPSDAEPSDPEHDQPDEPDQRDQPDQPDKPAVGAGRAFFDELSEGTCVAYRVVQVLPKGSERGKRAKRKWGQKQVRYARAKIRRKAAGGLWVRDDSSGKQFWLSVSDVANRLVLWSEVEGRL